MRNTRLCQYLLPRNREIHTSTTMGLPHSPPSVSFTARSKSKKDVSLKRAAPETKGPILLLEGDNYRFSAGGIARSLYQLRPEPEIYSPKAATSRLSIEELYDLKSARKAFIVREKCTENGIADFDFHTNQEKCVHFGKSSRFVASLMLNEIADDGIKNRDGTGGRTWDSSIAMSAYFQLHPSKIFGNVIELGSGAGLGGILTYLFRSVSSSPAPFNSMTLTDANLRVLSCCNENVRSFVSLYPSFSSISVKKLDWYDFLSSDGRSSEYMEEYKFDTILVSDCAYKYADITALVSTIKGLLKKKHTSKAHIFGPSSRGGLQKLLSQLRQEPLFCVESEYIDLTRFRCEPVPDDDLRSLGGLQATMSSSIKENDFVFQSKFNAEYLHVTCSICFDSDTTLRKENSLFDID